MVVLGDEVVEILCIGGQNYRIWIYLFIHSEEYLLEVLELVLVSLLRTCLLTIV